MPVNIIIAAALSYILGSLPLSVMLLKLLQLPDPRAYGSSNIGATNVGRLHSALGFLVFILDASKVFVSCWIATQWGITGTLLHCMWLITTFGQTRSIFLHWTGGKGVSCFSAGVALFYPSVFSTLLLTFLIVYALTQYVWMASLTVLVLFALYSLSLPTPLLLLYLSMITWIVYLHRQNIETVKKSPQSTTYST